MERPAEAHELAQRHDEPTLAFPGRSSCLGPNRRAARGNDKARPSDLAMTKPSRAAVAIAASAGASDQDQAHADRR
jgi:hypothetical protein